MTNTRNTVLDKKKKKSFENEEIFKLHNPTHLRQNIRDRQKTSKSRIEEKFNHIDIKIYYIKKLMPTKKK